MFVRADWDAVKDRNAVLAPTDGEAWVLNARVNALWNNLSDNARRQISQERWPSNFLEINPQDADAWGIVSGDKVSVDSDNVIDQLGRKVSGGFKAVSYVSDIVPPGVTFTYFMYPGSVANNVTSADSSMQPLSLRYSSKVGRGSVTKVGTTDLMDTMSFVPRNLV